MRPFRQPLDRLRAARLRPTRQRLALAKILFDDGPRHVTAEELFREARAAGAEVSLATVYNTLNQFVEAGLLLEVTVGANQSYFDTNTEPHHHYFDRSTGALTDVPPGSLAFAQLPDPPDGKVIEGIEVVVRVRDAG